MILSLNPLKQVQYWSTYTMSVRSIWICLIILRIDCPVALKLYGHVLELIGIAVICELCLVSDEFKFKVNLKQLVYINSSCTE